MLVVLSLLFSGILIGFLGKNNSHLKTFGEKVSLTVLLMLITFGITIGNDESIIADFGKLGFAASVISTASVLGSVIFALLISKIKIKKERREK